MNVNKDRATDVLTYMKKVNTDWLTYGSITKLGAQNDERARFSFHKFLADNQLLQEYEERNGDVWIECPFHDDASPSCSINERKYLYHCFSCGSKGNLINLIRDYKNKFENSNASYYQILNDFLRTDKVMQAELGISTIFSEASYDNFNFEEALKPFKFKKPKGRVLPSSYLELSSELIKDNADLKQIKLFITLMQNHESVKDIYKELYSLENEDLNVEGLESISIDNLLSDDSDMNMF